VAEWFGVAVLGVALIPLPQFEASEAVPGCCCRAPVKLIAAKAGKLHVMLVA